MERIGYNVYVFKDLVFFTELQNPTIATLRRLKYKHKNINLMPVVENTVGCVMNNKTIIKG